jgi:hypothetical protein
MSDAEERNNERPSGDGAGPTWSFDGSVIRPGGQIGPFRIERELGRGAVELVYLAQGFEGVRGAVEKGEIASSLRSSQ